MPITVPESTLLVLAEVEGSNEKLADYELGSRLAGIHNKEGLSPDERKGAWAESAAFNFVARIGDTPSPWSTFFRPVFSGTKNDGAPFYAPDLAEVDGDIISHWEARSAAAKHPMSRARYSDLVWDFKKTVIGESPAVAFAQRACDAYLAVADTGTLPRIAGQFIPKASEARAFLSEIAKEHPLLGLIGVTKIADGHFAAKAGSIEKDPDGRLIMQLAENLALAAPFLNGAIRKAIEKHGLNSERILDVLYVSPAFDPDRRDLLKSGIDAYLAGDYIKTVHVLVPQIEHSLRRLLALLGEPVGKAGRNGTMQVKNLNDILREEAILNCLGEDLQMYLLTFLADARGQNLRNRITHGLAPMAQIDVQAADRLIHVLLAISLIRERSKQDP